MEEILCSIHNYTKFSGGKYSFYQMAQAGLDCGLDAIITTDKNIYPNQKNQYYYRDGKHLLVICGEELSNPLDQTSASYLSIGIDEEQFNKNISHTPNEIRILVERTEDRKSFRHLEIMNAEKILNIGITEGEKELRENADLFDRLLNTEQHYVCLAGTCSTVDKTSFSYQELFSTVCNHLLSEESLTGDFSKDKIIILKAIKMGHVFTAVDGLSNAAGFRFSAEGNNQERVALPGDMIHLQNSVTLKISIPEACLCRLICNGTVIKEWQQCKQVPYTVYEPGYYRVECALKRKNLFYDWIFSNPIYVVKG